MSSKSPRILCIAGPTASGKTALAIELCKVLPIEIISVDSALIYKRMNIGTGKPTKEELAIAPHHLIDIIEPWEKYSVANFIKDCESKIELIQNKGKIPILVGGTMMYFHRLIYGIADIPEVSAEAKQEVTELFKKFNLHQLHEKLSYLDSESATKINPNDSQRIQRALEVILSSNKKLSSFTSNMPLKKDKYHLLCILPDERKNLHQNIRKRFEMMVQSGLIDEVSNLLKHPLITPDITSMRSVGYRQTIDFIEKKSKNIEELIEAGTAATRQLAKRQITWIRGFDKSLVTNLPMESIKKEQMSHIIERLKYFFD